MTLFSCLGSQLDEFWMKLTLFPWLMNSHMLLQEIRSFQPTRNLKRKHSGSEKKKKRTFLFNGLPLVAKATFKWQFIWMYNTVFFEMPFFPKCFPTNTTFLVNIFQISWFTTFFSDKIRFFGMIPFKIKYLKVNLINLAQWRLCQIISHALKNFTVYTNEFLYDFSERICTCTFNEIKNPNKCWISFNYSLKFCDTASIHSVPHPYVSDGDILLDRISLYMIDYSFDICVFVLFSYVFQLPFYEQILIL